MGGFRGVTLLMSVSLLGVACGGPEPVPPAELTWEEFQARAYKEPGTDVYIVEGDMAFEGTEALRHYFDAYVAQQPGQRQDGLTLNASGAKWASTQRMNLTYCVNSSSFGSRYSTVVSAMNNAAAAWEAIAGINFVHLSQYDSNCTSAQAAVVFDVRMVNSGGQYLARAFFPNTSRSARELLIDSSVFGSIAPLTLTGLLRHELGHTLGFVHESDHPDAPLSTGCYTGTVGIALTAYDPHSVMHYPQCSGSSGDFIMTSLDRQGAASAYPR